MSTSKQVANSKKLQNLPTHAIKQVKRTASEMGNNQTIIYAYPPNLKTINTEKVLAQVQTQSRNSTPVLLSPPVTKKNPQTKAPTMQSSQNFKRPSEIMKSPPLFNPNSFQQKTLKSPPVQSAMKPSFKSPPVSLPRSTAEEKNISPSTVCSSDVFPVSCKELGRRIQERIASQREAESQRISQGQRSHTGISQGQMPYTSQREGDKVLLSQGNESYGWKKQGTPVKIISLTNTLTEQCSTKAAVENMVRILRYNNLAIKCILIIHVSHKNVLYVTFHQ